MKNLCTLYSLRHPPIAGRFRGDGTVPSPASFKARWIYGRNNRLGVLLWANFIPRGPSPSKAQLP